MNWYKDVGSIPTGSKFIRYRGWKENSTDVVYGYPYSALCNDGSDERVSMESEVASWKDLPMSFLMLAVVLIVARRDVTPLVWVRIPSVTQNIGKLDR